MERYHIVPLNDLKPHIETGTYCPCAPFIRRVPPNELIIHNAYDGREFYEQEFAREEQLTNGNQSDR